MLKDAIRKALRTRGLELINMPNLGGFLASRQCDLVIDVGANAGQFGGKLRRLGYRGKILSFEPVERAFQSLQVRAASDGRWEARRTALGAREGAVQINVSQDARFSSILPLTNKALGFSPSSAVTSVEEVPVTTLDLALNDMTAQRPFIKVDTQGFERDVLLGSSATLTRATGLMLELPIEHLYEGVWEFSEAIVWLDAKGFKLAQIVPVSARENDRESALEFDCVFRRAD